MRVLGIEFRPPGSCNCPCLYPLCHVAFPFSLVVFPLVLLETAFHCVALAAVELCRLKVFSQRSVCLCLHSGRVISLCSHVHLFLLELRFSCLHKYFYERSCLFNPTTFFQIYFHLWMKFHVWMFYLHLFMCTVYAWYNRDRKEGIGSLDIGIIGGFELPCVCWKLGVLQEQPLVLISESSLQFPSPSHPQIF